MRMVNGFRQVVRFPFLDTRISDQSLEDIMYGCRGRVEIFNRVLRRWSYGFVHWEMRVSLCKQTTGFQGASLKLLTSYGSFHRSARNDRSWDTTIIISSLFGVIQGIALRTSSRRAINTRHRLSAPWWLHQIAGNLY